MTASFKIINTGNWGNDEIEIIFPNSAMDGILLFPGEMTQTISGTEAGTDITVFGRHGGEGGYKGDWDITAKRKDDKGIGDLRTRTDFNPSSDELIQEIKDKTAELITLMNDLPLWDNVNYGEQLRLRKLAQTAFEEASMWGVKAVALKFAPGNTIWSREEKVDK